MTDLPNDRLPTGAGTAAEVEARPAATTIVMRGHPFRVLFLRRVSTSTFVPDAWIFPGGAVDPIDRRIAGTAGELELMQLSAARELFEEAGIWIGAPLENAEEWRRQLLDHAAVFQDLVRHARPRLERLVWTSRWVTPVGVPKRYDTWFFLLSVDDRTEATPEQREGVEIAWLTPREALERHGANGFPMVFPTIRNLMAIERWEDADALLSSRAGAEIPTTRPVLVVEGGRRRILLPGDA